MVTACESACSVFPAALIGCWVAPAIQKLKYGSPPVAWLGLSEFLDDGPSHVEQADESGLCFRALLREQIFQLVLGDPPHRINHEFQLLLQLLTGLALLGQVTP